MAVHEVFGAQGGAFLGGAELEVFGDVCTQEPSGEVHDEAVEVRETGCNDAKVHHYSLRRRGRSVSLKALYVGVMA